MNTRDDIHRELFGTLAARERYDSPRPVPNRAALHELQCQASFCKKALEYGKKSIARRHAMNAAVAALQIVYSLDDALS